MRRAKRGEAQAFMRHAMAFTGPDCLEWPFAQNSSGYGLVLSGRSGKVVSRVVCIAVHGEPAHEQDEAAHSCGNRLCCNPGHIRWATPKENFADRLRHGTHQNGERNHQSKLTWETVGQIRRTTGLSTRALGRKFGVSSRVICGILRGEYWAEGAPR